MKKFKKAPLPLFNKFAKYFPFPTVEVIIRDGDSILLTKRSIAPYKNYWHFPGGVVFKMEKLRSAAKRISKEELNLNIKIEKFLGVYENPVIIRHDITHVFTASVLNGKIKLDSQSNDVKFFKIPPKNMIPYHRKIFLDAKSF